MWLAYRLGGTSAVRLMVIGGVGTIGTELVCRVASEPGINDILNYANLWKSNYNLFTGMRKAPGNNVRFFQVDILDSKELKKQMSGVDVVLHLAARAETPYAVQNLQEFEETNHWGGDCGGCLSRGGIAGQLTDHIE